MITTTIGEVSTAAELRQEADLAGYAGSVRIAVGALIFSENGELLLQRRGPTARDEQGKLEGVGGEVEENDTSLRTALQREIREELGWLVSVRIQRYLCTQFVEPQIESDGWLIALYTAIHVGGRIVSVDHRHNGTIDCRSLTNYSPEELSQSAQLALPLLRLHRDSILRSIKNGDQV